MPRRQGKPFNQYRRLLLLLALVLILGLLVSFWLGRKDDDATFTCDPASDKLLLAPSTPFAHRSKPDLATPTRPKATPAPTLAATPLPKENSRKLPSPQDDPATRDAFFTLSPLTEDDKRRMRQSGSLNDDTPVPSLDLMHLSVLHVDFDGETQRGELIVHRLLAEEVLEIFETLFAASFPIEQIRLIDEFEADDEKSMAANNSYAFCTRPILGQENTFSLHSYGLAIDINPVQNPYIRDGNILPDAAENYLDRKHIRPGMIVPGNVVHEAFTQRGWTWGGSWQSLKDYHHFEKRLPDVP